MKPALSVYWWQGKPNFGDALNLDIISYVSGRKVVWANQARAEMFGFGSIMGGVRDRVGKNSAPFYVWGAGMMRPIRFEPKNRAAITLVRGPISACLLELDNIAACGDPGLLAPMVYGIDACKTKKWRFGVLPHIVHHDLAVIKSLQEALPNSVLIKLQSNSTREIVETMNRCEIIISSSLHGLIVADALGIPNIWLEPEKLNELSRFKFYDYALAVGRPMAAPMIMEAAMKIPEIEDIPTQYIGNIPAVQKNILESFPNELAA